MIGAITAAVQFQVIKYLFTLLLLVGGNFLYGQFTAGVAYELSFLRTEQEYLANLYVYNDNETIDVYRMETDLGVSAHGITFRSFGNQFNNPKRFNVGYSLEIGYRGFSSKGRLIYQGSSTTYRDSIINEFADYEFRSRYHSIRFNHFVDLHWNPSERIKFTHSIGAGLTAIVKGGAAGIPFDGTMVSTNHPVLTAQYQPQITEKYDRFSITYFAGIDLFAMPLFTKLSEYETPDYRVPLSGIRFNTIGLRFIPHPRKRKEPVPVEELY